MHGKELRWLVVFKREFQGLSAEVVHEHLLIPECTQRRWLSFLKKYNDVFPPRVKKLGRPAKLGHHQEVVQARGRFSHYYDGSVPR
jgi:transposase